MEKDGILLPNSAHSCKLNFSREYFNFPKEYFSLWVMKTSLEGTASALLIFQVLLSLLKEVFLACHSSLAGKSRTKGKIRGRQFRWRFETTVYNFLCHTSLVI